MKNLIMNRVFTSQNPKSQKTTLFHGHDFTVFPNKLPTGLE